ncbi:uncharacterized protein GIQ15_03010 [Arthroderma uncinatum]|uniref:uncharacterized protein n=1 Tax=Arthroderma uncinatum TaxID=74035 RepID=UPI00144A7A23|nr:uncharacterized protein GIQ15_03010 [Arthroderma uncinatum]KAF3483686.1 hypothetical protein GIQ15_03010 [Arthroderma uncinatum]
MDKLFPHPEYAEDQPRYKTILTLHVLRAGLTAGSVLSVLSATLTTLYKEPSALLSSQHGKRLLVHASHGGVAGFVVSGVMLTARMWGKEDIEWQDRSWRLLENKGQCEADTWIAGGGLIGGLSMAMLGKGRAAAATATASAVNKTPAIVVRPLDSIMGGMA